MLTVQESAISHRKQVGCWDAQRPEDLAWGVLSAMASSGGDMILGKARGEGGTLGWDIPGQ